MPVSVRLDFVKPEEPNYVKLHIFEAAVAGGPYSEIEVVNVVSPNYPTRYTTNAASSLTNWFSIEWEDDKGARSPRSNPVQGGTENVVGMITSRALIRDTTLNEEVVAQEAEAVIEAFYGKDPYDMTIDPTHSELSALTYVTMARAYIGEIVVAGSGESYTAGLVSQKSNTASADRTKLVKWLLDAARPILGATTLVLLLEDIDPTGLGATSAIEWDASRTMVTFFDE